jgi:2-phosphoglycerate kinase
MTHTAPAWTTLLIGGPSGAGKTTIGRTLSRQLGIDFMMVDDLRLAFQHSHVSFPSSRDTAPLYMFWDISLEHMWSRRPEDLSQGLIALGQAMTPAIEVVVMNHVDQRIPIVIEGDNIVPALLARPQVRTRATGGRVAGVFLVEPDEEAFLENILARGGWSALDEAPAWMPTQVRTKWLYGRWLAAEATRYGIPVIEARPWQTLADRLLSAARSTTQV